VSTIVRWRNWSGGGFEHLILIDHEGYTEARSIVISGPVPSAPEGFAAYYSLKLDSDWRTLEVEASVLGMMDAVHLRRLHSGEWLNRDERLLHQLSRSFDVDLSITPFTNTLPIRRLGLKIGAAAEITVAYIAFPELTVSAEPQRYTRLASDRYRFESIDGGFVREIVVDEDGFVITYPDLFYRV
jgi:hypothetical protein